MKLKQKPCTLICAAPLNTSHKETKSKQICAVGSHGGPEHRALYTHIPVPGARLLLVTLFPYRSLYSRQPDACPTAPEAPGKAPGTPRRQVSAAAPGWVMDGCDNLVS